MLAFVTSKPANHPLFSGKKGGHVDTQMKDQSYISNKNGWMLENRIVIYLVLEGAPESGDVIYIYIRISSHWEYVLVQAWVPT